MSTEHAQAASPYHEAWDFIFRHSTSGGSYRMAKLVLSLYNGDEYPFSLGECLLGLDSNNERIALEIVAYYMKHRENDALREIGEKIFKHYPYLSEVAEVMYNARQEFNRR